MAEMQSELSAWLLVYRLLKLYRFAALAVAGLLWWLHGLPGALLAGVFWYVAGLLSPRPTETLDRYTGRKKAGD
jgi:hypothetical protein